MSNSLRVLDMEVCTTLTTCARLVYGGGGDDGDEVEVELAEDDRPMKVQLAMAFVATNKRLEDQLKLAASRDTMPSEPTPTEITVSVFKALNRWLASVVTYADARFELEPLGVRVKQVGIPVPSSLWELSHRWWSIHGVQSDFVIKSFWPKAMSIVFAELQRAGYQVIATGPGVLSVVVFVAP